LAGQSNRRSIHPSGAAQRVIRAAAGIARRYNWGETMRHGYVFERHVV